MKRINILVTALLIFICASLNAQQPVKAADWTPYNFLIGEWVGDGSGAPGQGTGSVTFSLDLLNRVLVRRGSTDFPMQGNRPAFTHQDLMIVFQQEDKTKAMYWDNEGHVINYAVEFSKDGKKLYFTSEIIPQSPRFRLVYERLEGNKINSIFEIAPPAKPDEFSKYLEGIVIKK